MVNSVNVVNSIEQVQKAESGVKTWEEEVKNRAGALIPALYKKSKDVTYSWWNKNLKVLTFTNCYKERSVNKASISQWEKGEVRNGNYAQELNPHLLSQKQIDNVKKSKNWKSFFKNMELTIRETAYKNYILLLLGSRTKHGT